MRNAKVISISLAGEMVEEAEELAKRGNRSTSEWMRKAFQCSREWERILALGRENAKQTRNPE
jgi:metal-responsive CopG/Arc/MetJ family transcriptional regulator